MGHRKMKDPLGNLVRKQIAAYVKDAPGGIREADITKMLREEKLVSGKAQSGVIYHLQALQREGYVKIEVDEEDGCKYVYPLKGGPLDTRSFPTRPSESPEALQRERNARPHVA